MSQMELIRSTLKDARPNFPADSIEYFTEAIADRTSVRDIEEFLAMNFFSSREAHRLATLLGD